jgi:hypothetical protein
MDRIKRFFGDTPEAQAYNIPHAIAGIAIFVAGVAHHVFGR